MSPGIKIKRLRQARKLTQQALANKVKVHRVYLAHVEAGRKLPSLMVLVRIAKALKVTVAELVR